jgi:outer membrane protein assembly factor BamB
MSIETPPDIQKRRRPVLLLPFWLWTILLTAIAIIVIRTTDIFPDPGMRNALTMSIGALAFILVVFWFVAFSRSSGAMRWGALVLLLMLGGVFVAAKQVENPSFTGDMRVSFPWRPAVADFLGIKPPQFAAPQSGKVELAVTSRDFPQFLGPTRDGVITGVKLSPDWEKSKPELLWKQPIGEGWSGFAIVGNLALTLEQRSEEEWATCYDLKTGRLEWSSPLQARHEQVPGGIGPRSTPTIHEGRIYTMGATGVLRCLEGTNGSVLWEHDLLAEYGLKQAEETSLIHWGRSASPLIVGDAVVVPAGGAEGKRATLVAYHKRTGAKLWEGGDRIPSYSSPTLATIDGVQQILVVSEDYAGGYDATNGKRLWEVEWNGKSSSDANVSNANQVGPDLVLLSKGYGAGGRLLKITRKDGTWTASVVWSNFRILRTKFSNVVIKDGFVYALSDSGQAGQLECIELATGKRRWRGSAYGYGQILLVGDYLLVTSEEGEIVLLDATTDGERVRGRVQAIEGTTWNNAALAGPYLLVRNGRQAACFKLPLAKE